MSGYIIANLEVTDPEGFAGYAGKAPATIAAHGGEYLARGGAAELMEGDLPVGRVVVIRFPSAEVARTGTTPRDTRPCGRSGCAPPAGRSSSPPAWTRRDRREAPLSRKASLRHRLQSLEEQDRDHH